MEVRNLVKVTVESEETRRAKKEIKVEILEEHLRKGMWGYGAQMKLDDHTTKEEA